MGLYNDADRLGREVQAKLDAQKTAKAVAKRAQQQALRQQKRHEEDKKQGMI
jgi:hypothetical protein